MEAQIKEETQEDSIVCPDTSSETNLASLSIIEKYSMYIQNEDSEMDSDCDLMPDDSVFREQFDNVAREAHNNSRSRSNRLSMGLPERPRESVDEGDQKPLICYNELLKKLAEVRKCGPDGNSIFCTEQELNDIQERYGDILSFIQEKASTFPMRESNKDCDNDEQVDVGNATPEEQRKSMRLLAEKIASVEQARDLFYEVEQQVREQVEQLELVERYKMESVG